MLPREFARRHWRWFVLAGVLFFVANLLFVVLAIYGPFSQKRVTQSLEETFPAKVTFVRFRQTHFPHPGCVAEGVAFYRLGSHRKAAPLVTITTLTIDARYTDFLFRPHYVKRIILDGMRISIPPSDSENRDNSAAAPPPSTPTNTRIGEIVADGAILEIARNNGKARLRFEGRSLSLKSVQDGSPFSYETVVLNALPPGEIRSSGTFGPWISGAAARTAVQGTYKFDRADLGVFHGIGGILSSEGNFQGMLGWLDARGNIDIPDFGVTRSGHRVHLTSSYKAVIDGTNGDVALQRVEASFLHTTVVASGRVVASRPPLSGKTTSVDLDVANGRIQDVLRLFSRSLRPPLNGPATFRAHVNVSPEGRPFLQEVQLQGDFGVADGHFTRPSTQRNVAQLSERASGKNPDKQPDADADPEGIVSDISGHVVLRNGVATLADFAFQVPGARAQMHGTYHVTTEEINLHGTLQTDVSFSQTTTGVKSVLLKPFNVFFKRKPRGATIPVKLTGPYSHPTPAVDIP